MKAMITLKKFLESIDFDTLKSKYTKTDDSHRIDAFNESGAVGYIEWNDDDGEVDRVFVGRPYRRLGVGTRLWELATEWAEKHDAVPPEHSSTRSEEGDAWARSIGGHIPSLSDDVDGWSSR